MSKWFKTKYKSKKSKTRKRIPKKSQSAKKSPGIKKTLSRVLPILAVIAFAAAAIWFGYEQVQELKKIRLSEELQSGFDEEFHHVEYEKGDVFNLLIVVESESRQKPILEGFVLLRLDSHANTASVISLPPSVYVSAMPSTKYSSSAGDADLLRFRDFMVVGELQTPPIPLAYTVYHLEELMALPIDGYVFVPQHVADEFSKIGVGYSAADVIENGRSYNEWSGDWNSYWVDFVDSISIPKIWLAREHISAIESNMEVVDLYDFIRDFQAVPRDHIMSLSIDDKDLVEQVNERGEIVNVAPLSAIDAMLEELESDERMEREQARIEILNGSSTQGLGARYERWITHIGGDVIRVKNAPGKWQNTVIYVTDPEEYPYTMEQVIAFWEGVEIVEGRPDFITTGDIIIVLGVE